MGITHTEGTLGQWPWPTIPNTWVNDLGAEIVRDPLQIPFPEDNITPYVTENYAQRTQRLPADHPHRRDGFVITEMRVYPRRCNLGIQFFGPSALRAVQPHMGWHNFWVRRWALDDKGEKRAIRTQGPDIGAVLPIVTPSGNVVRRTFLKGPADLQYRLERALVVLDDLATKGVPGTGEAAIALHKAWTSVCFRQALRQFFRGWAELGEGHRGPMHTAPLTEALTGVRPDTPGEENELLHPWMLLAPWPPSSGIVDEKLWKKWRSASKFETRNDVKDQTWETPGGM